MTRRPRCPQTGDLLAWEPPQPVESFEPQVVRAASLGTQIARALSRAMQDSGRTREQIAKEISAYLGEEVSEDILNKYSSEAAEKHIVNVVRFLALLHVTRDRRLLQLLAEPFGWAVVEQRHVEAIHLAAALEQKRELDLDIAAIRRRVEKTGALK